MRLFSFILLFLSSLSAAAQTSFTVTPLSSTYDFVGPGRGANYWFNSNALRRKAFPNAYTLEYSTGDSTTSTVADYYIRVNWGQIEAAGSGTSPASSNRFSWSALDFYFKAAIDQGAKLSFGILTIATGYNPYGDGTAALGYPTWLHNVMQAEALAADRDYIGAGTWVPNWNHASYLSAIDTLTKACAAWIAATSYTPSTGPKAGQSVPYSAVLNRVDIRGYGNFGEWNLADVGAGSGNQNVTKASLQAIVNTHKNAFPNYQLQMLMEALTITPSGAADGEFAYWMLTQSNNFGKYGYRMDNWGQGIFNLSVQCNPDQYNPGSGLVDIQDLIDTVYKYAPVDGEPSNFADGVTVPSDPSKTWWGNSWCGPCDLNSKNFGYCGTPYPNGTTLYLYGELPRQVRERHATSFGNGNFGGSYTSGTGKDSILAAWRSSGARIQVSSGNMSNALTRFGNFNVVLNFRNTGSSPVYENFNTQLELRDGSNNVVNTWSVPFTVKGLQPSAVDSLVSLTLNCGNVAAGSGYKLVLIMRDPSGYRKPYPLALQAPAQDADGGFTLRSSITVSEAVASTNRIYPTKDKMFDMRGRKDKSIFGLFDDNTATKLNINGIADDFAIPFESWIALDSFYNNFSLEYFDNFGNTGSVLVTLVGDDGDNTIIDANRNLDPGDSLTSFSMTTEGFNTWKTVSGIAGFTGVRYIRFRAATATDLDAGVYEVRIYGDATAAAPSVFSSATPVTYTDPGAYWFGLNMLDDFNMDTAIRVAKSYRIGYEGSRLDKETVNRTNAFESASFVHKLDRFGTNHFNTRVFNHARTNNIRIQNYFNGGNIKHLDATTAGTYNYGTWTATNDQKYMVPGADSTLKATWYGRARRDYLYTALFGSNTSASLTGFTTEGGTATAGQGGLYIYEIENEFSKDWRGGTANYSPAVMYTMMDTVYAKIKQADPNMKVYLGAVTFCDTTMYKALYFEHFLRNKFSKAFPADGFNMNLYLSDTRDGQAGNNTLAPGNWGLYSRVNSASQLLKKLFPAAYDLRMTELGVGTDDGSSFDANAIGGTPDSVVAFNYILQQFALLSPVQNISASFYYNALSDGSANFGPTMAAFEFPNPYTVTYYRIPGKALRQQYDMEKNYNAWSTIVTNGDSTAAWVLSKTHQTDPNKKLYKVFRSNAAHDSESNKVVNVGANAISATLYTATHTGLAPTSSSLTISGNTVTLPTVSNTMRWVEVTYSAAPSQAPIRTRKFRRIKIS